MPLYSKGKSLVTRAILARMALTLPPDAVAVTAPTGIAACARPLGSRQGPFLGGSV